VTPVNVTLTNANTAYSSGELPTYSGSMQCRTSYDVICGATLAAVDTASPPGPYFTIKAGTPFTYDKSMYQKTFYFASATAGVVVEIVPELDKA
jgi:hypothetical protein